MERTQIGGNRILIILLILIISTILSACAVGNDPENSFPASEVPDKHSESDPADTQTVTDLTFEDVPTLVPDVLKRDMRPYRFWKPRISYPNTHCGTYSTAGANLSVGYLGICHTM